MAKQLNLNMIETRRYKADELLHYIDWTYFMHAWQFPVKYATAASLHQCRACQEGWIASFGKEQRNQAKEALNLVLDALQMLHELDSKANVIGRVGLFDANSLEDDIVITCDNGRQFVIPCLRQQTVVEGKPCYCLADFVRPRDYGNSDRIGVFATTVQFDIEKEYVGDSYKLMLAQTLCDRLAEAAACVFHLEVRRKIWGYAPDEELPLLDLLHEHYQGIRPAVGYPSLPDQSINFILDQMIDMKEMGITLTENGAMRPHATVTGLMIAYPRAKYFAVGQIDQVQLEDYARRRGLPLERMRQFLAANLKTVS